MTAAATEFATSEMTIRRDLDRLVARGVARRVRGGAISLLMRGEELPFAMREMEAIEAKRRIAARTGELIRDGEAVILDSGTTALEVARVLAAGRRATVMALSLHAAMVLATNPAIRLLVPGGETRFGELAMVGPWPRRRSGRCASTPPSCRAAACPPTGSSRPTTSATRRQTGPDGLLRPGSCWSPTTPSSPAAPWPWSPTSQASTC